MPTAPLPTVTAAAFMPGQPALPEWVSLTLSSPVSMEQLMAAVVVYDGAGGPSAWAGGGDTPPPPPGGGGGGGGPGPLSLGPTASQCLSATYSDATDIISEQSERSVFVHDFSGVMASNGCACSYELTLNATWNTYRKGHLVFSPLDQQIWSSVEQTILWNTQWNTGLTAGDYKVAMDWENTSDITWAQRLTSTEYCPGGDAEATSDYTADATVDEIDLGGAPGGTGHHPAVVRNEFMWGADLPYPLSARICPVGVDPEDPGSNCDYTTDRRYFMVEATDDHRLLQVLSYFVFDWEWWDQQGVRLAELEGLVDACIAATGASVHVCLEQVYNDDMTAEEKAHVCMWGGLAGVEVDDAPVAPTEPQDIITPPLIGHTGIVDHDRQSYGERYFWAIEAPAPLCCKGSYYVVVGDYAGNWTRTAPVLHPDAPEGTLEVTLTKPTHTEQYVNLHPLSEPASDPFPAVHADYPLDGTDGNPASEGYPNVNAGELQFGVCPDTGKKTPEELDVDRSQRGTAVCLEAQVKHPDVSALATTTVFFEWIDPSFQSPAGNGPDPNPGVWCDFGRKDKRSHPLDTYIDCKDYEAPPEEDRCDKLVPETGGPIPPGGPACDNRGTPPNWIGVNSLIIDSNYVGTPGNCSGTTCTVHTWVSVDRMGGDNFRFRALCDCQRGGEAKTVRSEWSAAPLTAWRLGDVRVDRGSNAGLIGINASTPLTLADSFYAITSTLNPMIDIGVYVVKTPCDAAGGVIAVAHSSMVFSWGFHEDSSQGDPYPPEHKWQELNFQTLTPNPGYSCGPETNPALDLHWAMSSASLGGSGYFLMTTSAHEMGHTLLNWLHGAPDDPTQCPSKDIEKSIMYNVCTNAQPMWFAAKELTKMRANPGRE